MLNYQRVILPVSFFFYKNKDDGFATLNWLILVGIIFLPGDIKTNVSNAFKHPRLAVITFTLW
jgi:hypothetical protein